jgi:hypothetical protein
MLILKKKLRLFLEKGCMLKKLIYFPDKKNKTWLKLEKRPF